MSSCPHVLLILPSCLPVFLFSCPPVFLSSYLPDLPSSCSSVLMSVHNYTLSVISLQLIDSCFKNKFFQHNKKKSYFFKVKKTNFFTNPYVYAECFARLYNPYINFTFLSLKWLKQLKVDAHLKYTDLHLLP